MQLKGILNNGLYAEARVVELHSVPYFELLGQSPQEAMISVDEECSRLLADIARRFYDGTFALELLLLSTKVENQLYRAQPHVYIVFRKYGQDDIAVSSSLEEAVHDLASSLQQLGYTYKVIKDEETGAFMEALSEVDTRSAYSLAREERAFGAMNSPSAFYYNDPVPQDALRNSTLLTNALAERPASAFSLVLIPTLYTDAEVRGIEQRRMYLDVLRKQVMMTPGASTPTNYSEASKAYLDFIGHSKEQAFYFLPVVYSSPRDLESLSNKLLSLFAGREDSDTHMLRFVDMSDSATCLTDGFLLKPWTVSDTLVFRKRNQSFWSRDDAPKNLFRIRQLLTFSTAKCMFRFPFDDGSTVGLESNRNSTAREKLDDAVLSEESFRIGTITDSGYAELGAGGKAVQAGIPLNHFSKHGMIVGKSGSGKTNFVHTMLIRLAQAGVPFLAIEPTKTEYRCLVDAIPNLKVFTPGMNNVSPFIINPFVPPVGVTVESYIPCLMSAFETAFTMPDPLPSIFREVINKTYNKYGWKMSSTCDDPSVTWFGFHEMIRVFQDHVTTMDYEGDVKGNITTAGVLRLSSLIEQNANIYDTTQTIPVHELLKQPVVLELNAITAKDQKTLLMALLLVEICNYTKFNTSLDGDLKNVLLIDEAHVLFGNAPDGTKNRAASELEDMIAEIRAYGTGVFVADQSPATFGASIIANTDTKIMFQVVEEGSRDILKGATGLTDTKKDLLSKLKMGECLLYYGKLPEPILVMADYARDIAPFRRDVPNEDVRESNDFWKSHKALLMPYNDCSCCDVCAHDGCNLAIRSTTEFIASSMVNFYSQYIKSEKALESFISTKAEETVYKQLRKHKLLDDKRRAGYCVMTRFMRRLLRARRYQLSETDLSRLRNLYAKYEYNFADEKKQVGESIGI